jgi:hypothetical protein
VTPQGADDLWADLVIAMLAVNNYTLEKTYAHVEALQELGLLSPDNLAAWEPAEVAQRLGKAGYDRGQVLNGMLAERLCALGAFVVGRDGRQCASLLRQGQREAAARLLSTVKGVGPVVLRSYFDLRGDRP